MRNVWTIAKREYNQYFTSPIAYAVGLMIMAILGFIFYSNILGAVYNQYAPTVSIVTNPLVSLFLFTTPAITMRVIADELKQGTMETLLTAPIRDGELVIGKWLGAVLFALTILAFTLIYPLILNSIISPGIDQGLMISQYIGLILLISTFLAIGVFVSSLFQNQIAAFFVTLAVLLIFWMISYPAQMATTQTLGTQIITYLDLSKHFSNFFAGTIYLKDIIYYISMTVLALFLGTLSVESRRWR
jgi:ABC-2 type transport system permease protein